MTQFVLIRGPVLRTGNGQAFTPGKLYYKGLFFAHTSEEEDRFLENNPLEKNHVCSAVARGRYRLTTAYSPLFQCVLPVVLDVPGFGSLRIHGGDRSENANGDIRVGKVRTATGLVKCTDSVQRLVDRIDAAADAGAEVWIEVK